MTDPGEQEAGGPRLDPFEITRWAREAYGDDGRPGLPITAHWPIFPFVTEGLQVRLVEEPVVPEPPRRDEAAQGCTSCALPDDHFLWTGERWRISMPDKPMSLPGVTLHPRQHLDFGDLTDEMGSEMGVLLVRIERALASIEGVGRVHMSKWGDGGAHLHVFLMARPHGMMQLRGMFLTTWMHVLPPLPLPLWTSIRAHVAAALALDTGDPPAG